MVLVLGSQLNGSNSPSIRSLVVDEEMMQPDHWFGSVL